MCAAKLYIPLSLHAECHILAPKKRGGGAKEEGKQREEED